MEATAGAVAEHHHTHAVEDCLTSQALIPAE